MPDLVVIERAVVILAAASVIQTAMLVGAMVFGYRAWRRAEHHIGAEMATLRASLDDTLREARAAARQIERVAEGTSHLAEQTRGVIRTATTAVAAPTTVALAGAARMVSRVVSRWQGRRAGHDRSVPVSIKEARHVPS